MGLITAILQNPVKVAVGVLLVLLFGLIAAFEMPIQLVPEVQRPVLSIETVWPGASPQEVEREIVQEQEEQLKGVEGVRKMTSESMNSRGTVTLEFGVGEDMSAALLQVNARLQQVPDYPEDALEPVITSSSSSDTPVTWIILQPRVPTTAELEAWVEEIPAAAEVLASAARAHSMGLRARRLERAAVEFPDVAARLPERVDIAKQKRFAEDMIEARLERVSGVSNVNVYGGRQEELQVVFDPRKLAARGITIQQLRLALRVQNRDTSAGDFDEGKRRYVVRTLGQFDSPQDVADVVVARRDGVAVYVRDLAVVKLGYRKAEATVDNIGRPCLAINAVRETGANVLDVMDGLKAAIDELNAGVVHDHGLHLEMVYDETEYIESAIGLVRQNIVLGGILTTLVLLLFLRSVRSTLVISLAIPTSVIGTFMLLGLMGRSLNVISLAGLAFAVGMLVDNAVVVLENIYRRYQRGESRFEAAANGAKEVWGAVLASTLTTLAVFVPILFLEDEVGQLFGDIAVAISCAVGLSLIVSVTVIPTATARVLSKRNRHADAEAPDVNARVPKFLRPVVRPFDRLGGAFVKHVLDVHRWLERGILRQVGLVLLLVALALVLAWRLWPKTEYLPQGNQNLAFAMMLPPPGYNLDEFERMGASIDDHLEPYWNVDPGSPEEAALDHPSIRSYFYVAFGGIAFMGASANEPLEAGGLIPMIDESIARIPGTFGGASQASLFERGITASRAVDIEIRGPELETLIAIGSGIYMKAQAMFADGQVIPRPSLDLSSPEVHVRPHSERMADVGVTARDLGYTVDAFVDGAYAGDFYSGGDRIDLRLVGLERYASRLQDLDDLPVATPTGNLVPLGALADISLSSGPQQINRRERERTITIQVTPPRDLALEEAIEMVQSGIIAPLKEDGTIGGAYRITLGGTADKLEQTLSRLGSTLLLAVLITYLLMAALFESWLYPFVVILSVPLGAVGGLLGLGVLNLVKPQPLDTLTMIGFIILIGTVVNNAILIVHQALNLMRAEGRAPKEAVLESVRTRIRPIFMTLFTTIFGLAPLVLFPGAGSELYRGIGSILIGGLVVSTVFTLLLVPTLFRLTLLRR